MGILEEAVIFQTGKLLLLGNGKQGKEQHHLIQVDLLHRL
jgi:hypothetical protein